MTAAQRRSASRRVALEALAGQDPEAIGAPGAVHGPRRARLALAGLMLAERGAGGLSIGLAVGAADRAAGAIAARSA